MISDSEIVVGLQRAQATLNAALTAAREAGMVTRVRVYDDARVLVELTRPFEVKIED